MKYASKIYNCLLQQNYDYLTIFLAVDRPLLGRKYCRYQGDIHDMENTGYQHIIWGVQWECTEYDRYTTWLDEQELTGELQPVKVRVNYYYEEDHDEYLEHWEFVDYSAREERDRQGKELDKILHRCKPKPVTK